MTHPIKPYIITPNLIEIAKAIMAEPAPQGPKIPDASPEHHVPENAGITALLQDNFYIFPIQDVKAALTQKYIEFLKESGYADLNSCSGLGIEKTILKADDAIKELLARKNISAVIEENTNYIVSINHSNSKRLIEALGCQLLTTNLMYNLFIPYLKAKASSNPEAQATLSEMVKTKMEWLEDLVLDKSKVKIGTKTLSSALILDRDGRFGRSDLNEFGYPLAVRGTGEFYYFSPKGDKRAAFRVSGSYFVLDLNREPSFENCRLGVRRTKFFP